MLWKPCRRLWTGNRARGDVMDSSNETDLLNGAGKLQDIIKNLKPRFFTIEEFPFLNRDFLQQNILSVALQLDRSALGSYALGLNGKQLEVLLFDLRDASGQEEIQRAVQILKERISSRLIKLLTILYQYNDTSKGLNEGLKEISAMLKQKSVNTPEEAFALHFGDKEDKVEAVRETIEEMRWNIKECLNTYVIQETSYFAIKCLLSFLSTTSRQGLLLNRSWIIRIVESQPADQLKKLIENYLSTFELTEYHDGINLAILDKIGQPFVSTDWEPYSSELKKKFSQWCYLHRLKMHTIGVPKKYNVLAKYFDRVQNSYTIEDDDLLVIDFGEIVIADIYNRPYSFFYKKDKFAHEMAAWQADRENLPTFIRIDKSGLTARDFIIEEVEEPCVKLSYEGIDILYIQEMLDIKMGIEPDMRRKHLAKLIRKDHLKRKPIRLE